MVLPIANKREKGHGPCGHVTFDHPPFSDHSPKPRWATCYCVIPGTRVRCGHGGPLHQPREERGVGSPCKQEIEATFTQNVHCLHTHHTTIHRYKLITGCQLVSPSLSGPSSTNFKTSHTVWGTIVGTPCGLDVLLYIHFAPCSRFLTLSYSCCAFLFLH